jgi:hypothetical protein
MLEVLLVLVVLILLGSGAAALSRRRRRELERWRVRIRSLQAGTAIELVREGEQPLRIALLDPASAEFSMQLEEARATAIERATALNAAHRGLPS